MAGLWLAATAVLAVDLKRKTWSYTILQINAQSSDEQLIRWALKVDRVGRGVYAISGQIGVAVDITDDYFLAAESYMSVSGNNDYKKQPFKFANQTVNHFVENHYNKYFKYSLATCSDLPQGDPPRLERKTYTMTQCQVSNEHFPSYMPAGFYKIVFNGSGPVSWQIDFVLRIESNS